MEFTSFIAEFSCIGIKYSKTIPGANSKVTTKKKKKKINKFEWNFGGKMKKLKEHELT